MKVRLALAAVVVIGAGLRFWGLWYGLPHPLARPDEEIVVGHALETAISIKDPDAFQYPKLVYYQDPVRGRAIRRGFSWAYPYPDLVYYVDGAAMRIWRVAGEWTGAYRSQDDFLDDVIERALQYRIARSVGAVAGALTPLAAFAAGWFAYRRKSVALVSALIVSVNFLHARDSHYATVDVPMTLLLTLALAFALRALTSQRGRDILIAAGMAGLATSAKFNAAMIGGSIAVASTYQWLAAATGAPRRRVVVTLLLGGVVAAVLFAATSPYCIIHLKTVFFGLERQRGVLFSSEGVAAWRVFLSSTLPGAFGWIGFAAVVAGVARAIWKHRPADLVLLACVVPMFASMAAMTWVLPRYPLPIVPALAVLAADACVAALPSLRWGWVAALVAALSVQPLASNIAYNRLASLPDTRQLAADWAAAHLPSDPSVVVCRGYGAPVLDRAAITGPAVPAVECTLDRVRASGVRYVVVHTHPSIPFFRPPDDAMRWLGDHGQAVATFDPFRSSDAAAGCFYPGDAFYLPYCGFGAVERGGPVITVWALP